MFSLQSKISLARSTLFQDQPVYVQFYITARCILTCYLCNIIYAYSDVEECNIYQIELIAEKSVISDKFCCGGYGFKSSKEFLENYNFLGGGSNPDLYVSHIIQKSILSGDTFYAYEANKYEDYGTSQEYFEYIKDVRSIFCDFDGVLVINSSKFSNPPWQYKPNIDNLKCISDYLKKSPFSKIIITTSRPKNQKQNIINFLRSYEIECSEVITDLPHASRILINDFSKSNPYPTSQAINLVRDSNNLEDYL